MNIPPIMLKLGQLPVTRAVYEMLPHDLGTLTVTVIAQRAEVEGHA